MITSFRRAKIKKNIGRLPVCRDRQRHSIVIYQPEGIADDLTPDYQRTRELHRRARRRAVNTIFPGIHHGNRHSVRIGVFDRI
jgi:hypothetical protein